MVVADGLVGPEGDHPLPEEGLQVSLVGPGAGVGLGVSGPAHPFVPLRAVGRNRQGVAKLAALDVPEQPVDQLSGLVPVGRRGVVPAGRNFRGGEDESFDVLQGQCAFMGRDVHLDVLIAPEGLGGPDGDGTGAGGGIEVGVQGGPVGLVEDVSRNVPPLLPEAVHVFPGVPLEAGIELFAVREDDGVAGLQPAGGDGDFRNAHHVRAHVVDVRMRVRGRHQALGRQDFPEPDRLVVAGHEVEIDPVPASDDFRAHPVPVVESGLGPSLGLLAGVVPFALVEASQAYGAVLEGLPGVRAGDDFLPRSVLVGNDQAGEEGGVVPEEVEIRGREGHVTAEPAAGEGGREGIPAFLQQVRHVVLVVAQDFPELAVSGREPAVTDVFPVEEKVIDAHGRSVQAGLLDPFPDLEFGTELRLRAVGGIGPSLEDLPAGVGNPDFPVPDGHSGKAGEDAIPLLVEDDAVFALSGIQDLIVSEYDRGTRCGGETDRTQVRVGNVISAVSHPVQAQPGRPRRKVLPVDPEADDAVLHMDFEGVVGTVGQDVLEVRFRKVRPVDGEEGLVRTVFREVADPENADFGKGGFHFHPEIVLSGHAEDVLEGVLQAEIIRSQDQGGGASLLNPEIRTDIEETLGRGIQREDLGTDPFRSLPGALPGAQQAGFEAGAGFVRAAVLVPDGEFHPVTHLGLQGRSAIADAL